MTHHATRTLQELGYRLTPQRTLVWDVLRASEQHLSAEDICARIQQEFPNVNSSTVYRTLDLLVSLRLVKETCLGPARRFYEVEEEVPHHHLVCDVCGHVEHVHDEDLAGLAPVLADSHGFVIREVPIAYRERPAGSSSKLRTFRDGARVLWTIFNIARSVKPLTFFAAVALLLLILGILCAVPGISQYLSHGTVESFPLLFVGVGLVILSFGSVAVGVLLHAMNVRLKEITSLIRKAGGPGRP